MNNVQKNIMLYVMDDDAYQGPCYNIETCVYIEVSKYWVSVGNHECPVYEREIFYNHQLHTSIVITTDKETGEQDWKIADDKCSHICNF